MDTNEYQPAPEVDAFVRNLIEKVAHQRLPEFFAADHPNALYRIPNRHGVSVVALRTSDLTEQQLTDFMKYRLAQYLAVHFVDPHMIYELGMEHEPLARVSSDDVHILAGSAETGEILCYATLEAPPVGIASATLRSKDRPLFPVEGVHGWGIFNRLLVLPDLPASKLRELGRFVKNQRLHTFDELGARAPVEVAAAVFRTLSGSLRLEVEGIVGDLEEGVAKQNLDFFHVPMVVIHGTVPYEAETSYFFPRYQYCTVYPFAALASDISRAMLSRLDAIEEALERPGKQGVLGLLALRREIQTPRSTLEPSGGLTPLSGVQLPQMNVTMADRREMLDIAARLRSSDLFQGLSVAEGTVLGTFMTRRDVAAGETILHQGEVGTDLFLIEVGQARVETSSRAGDRITLATLGPGDYFGEIALITGEERNADVVAVTPVTMMQLSKDAYGQYLAQMSEIEQQVVRAAATRGSQTARRIRTDTAEPAEPSEKLDLADLLRSSSLFRDLSAADGTVLGTFMSRRTLGTGDVIVRQGEQGNDLFIIEAGQALVQTTNRFGDRITLATLGPGDYFGEIALVTGEDRSADVTAQTPMTILRLDKDGYNRYLAHTANVEQEITRAAATRASQTARRIMSGKE